MRRLLLATVGALLAGAAPAHAATFQVNTTANNATCNALTCSLPGAFNAALATPEADTITVPAGIYAVPELTSTGAPRVAIVGAGANATFIQPAATTRVFSAGPNSSLALAELTVRGGRGGTGSGGNVLAQSASTVSLAGVRLTDGQAANGGGLGSSGASSLTIRESLIDTNTATGGGTGGGVYLEGQTFATTLTVTDSTVARNSASTGAGIWSSAQPAITLRGVTLAYNAARSTQLGVGGLQSSNPAGGVVLQGSLIAGNTTRFVTGSNTIDIPSNCAVTGPVTDQGGNVEDVAQCGLGASSRTNTDAALATTFDASEPPVLTLPASSPAVDFADCAGRTLDQRGVPRPQGARCDAGAYEFNPLPTTAVAGAAPPFTFSSNEAGATFQCSLDGGPFTACASPFDPGAGPGTHTLAVRAVDAEGQPDPNPQTVTFTVQAPPTPTPTATPSPTPTPVAGRVIVVGPSRGTVRVKVPGSKRYVDLDVTRGIPVGSSVDTRKGRVTLTAIPKAGAKPETAVFFDGLFKVTQARGITTLTLTEQLAACPKRKGARASAKKPKKRRLWGDGKGSFRTAGKYSAATVRGTRWLVEDSCAGTLTRVTRGSVRVDHGKKRIILRAGKRYLAKPR